MRRTTIMFLTVIAFIGVTLCGMCGIALLFHSEGLTDGAFPIIYLLLCDVWAFFMWWAFDTVKDRVIDRWQ